MSRSKRKLIAQETLRIVEAGTYRNADDAEVSIAEAVQKAAAGTRLIRPNDFSSLELPDNDFDTEFVVRNETTFVGAQALLASGAPEVCSLNFASAKNPGGGFLGGSQAQEEALARASALYECLQQAMEYYEFHRTGGNCLYSHHMIYSPAVPVFRDDDDGLLDSLWLTSIITSPAVNAGAVRKNTPRLEKQIEPVMAERIEHVLTLAASQGHTNLVLGAWGCGVFRNDPKVIAGLFNDALATDRFRRMFERVRFSVLARNKEQPTLDAFREMF